MLKLHIHTAIQHINIDLFIASTAYNMAEKTIVQTLGVSFPAQPLSPDCGQEEEIDVSSKNW